MDAVQSIPIDLTAFLVQGANIGGINVKKITVELEDGKIVTIDLPVIKPLGGMKETVRDAIVEDMPPGETWSYEQISMISGYANTGKLRAYVKELAAELGLSIGNKGLMKPLVFSEE
jgi:hypothetical protein